MSYYNDDNNRDRKVFFLILLGSMILLWGWLLIIAGSENEMTPEKLIVQQLKMEEGWRSVPYLDTQSVATIGFGHNISGRKFTRIEHERFFPGYHYHISIEQMIDYWKKNPLSEEDGVYLLKQDLEIARQDCVIIFGKFWDDIPDEKKVPLVDMAFNLGLSRLMGFRKMIAAVKESNWEEAGKQIRNSRAYEQDKNRYKRLAIEISK